MSDIDITIHSKTEDRVEYEYGGILVARIDRDQHGTWRVTAVDPRFTEPGAVDEDDVPGGGNPAEFIRHWLRHKAGLTT